VEFDLIYTGFEPRQIDELLLTAGDDDAANQILEPPVNPVSRLGDLWCCGPHTVLHGDATSPEDVAVCRGTYGRN
jgi:hypothetical protein